MGLDLVSRPAKGLIVALMLQRVHVLVRAVAQRAALDGRRVLGEASALLNQANALAQHLLKRAQEPTPALATTYATGLLALDNTQKPQRG